MNISLFFAQVPLHGGEGILVTTKTNSTLYDR